MPVVEVDKALEIKPHTVYLAAENCLILFDNAGLVRPGKIGADTINRTIDKFLLSLSECFKKHAIGIILSGGNGDGAAGAVGIYNHGGQLIVQSPDSSLFKTMPEAVILKDHPIFVDRPQMLAVKISEIVHLN